jgi:hypothetical protein
MEDRTRVLDVETQDREVLIASVKAVMPTQDEPFLTQEEYAEIVAKGPPRYLYHSTDASRREQIAEEGLLLRRSETAELAREMGEDEWWTYGGVFFSTVIHDITPGEDVWVLDTEGWSWGATESGASPEEIVPDFSVDTDGWAIDEVWWYVRCDVAPEKIRVHELCYPLEEASRPSP